MRVTHSTAAAALALAGSASANLHELAQNAGLLYFGTATDNSKLSDQPYLAIVSDSTEFGQITPENGQKWVYTEPSQNSFSYTSADEIAQLAATNGQILRCHALVWHSQLPSWVSSGSWTVSTLTSVIENHISNLVGHYQGQCYAWDVVNEALNEDGTWRTSVFSTTFGGGDFIPVAFKAARAADPDTKLYYNDYNIGYSGSKHQAALAIIDLVRDAGGEIDGIGEQGHYIVGITPSQGDLENVASAYMAKDVEFAYTELDIRFQSLPPSESDLEQQASDYEAVVRACLNVGCVGITVWEFTDKYSWIPNVFSGQGAACLYDENLEKKPAYYTVESVLAAAATVTASTSTASTTSVPPVTTTMATSTTTASEPPTSTTSQPTALATHWGQCGGIGYTGPTVCEEPYECHYWNDWYWQCL